MSTKNVLVRRSSIIETLGAATVLCSDKTGTITQNKMKLGKITTADKVENLDGLKEVSIESKHILQIAFFASKHPSFDPMDSAISYTMESFHQSGDFSLLSTKEFPLTPNELTMVRVLEEIDGFVCYAKGSPEAIFKLCNLNESEIKLWTNKTNELAMEGYRVLAVAKSEVPSKEIPENRNSVRYKLYGLLSFLDPIREIVPEAVKTAYHSGIRVIMITGDYPETAKNIAKQIGLENADTVLTGKNWQIYLKKICVLY